mmetsp:Transcript_44904/g.149979  ORF Transcript_44904/g.149979 Transcript_44904/m.149979 type:complete len:268 (-) Transcript_44904:198-1001(-)
MIAPRHENSVAVARRTARRLSPCEDLTSALERQAYRKMSLKFHPDKNQDDDPEKNSCLCPAKEAADLFIKIAKAYETLTDDATRDNYEKYGNPDGYHGTSVTIGLPSWLTDKDNELAILVAYFVALIVIIPTVVGLWWRNSSKFLEDGVMQNTAYRFYRQISEHTAAKFMPGILSSPRPPLRTPTSSKSSSRRRAAPRWTRCRPPRRARRWWWSAPTGTGASCSAYRECATSRSCVTPSWPARVSAAAKVRLSEHLWSLACSGRWGR